MRAQVGSVNTPSCTLHIKRKRYAVLLCSNLRYSCIGITGALFQESFVQEAARQCAGVCTPAALPEHTNEHMKPVNGQGYDNHGYAKEHKRLLMYMQSQNTSSQRGNNSNCYLAKCHHILHNPALPLLPCSRSGSMTPRTSEKP